MGAEILAKRKVMLTCYDASFARLIADAGCVDYVLVGDSLGMVIYGATSTLEVSVDDMIRHTRAVKRGLLKSKAEKKPIVVTDLPVNSYRNPNDALKTAYHLKEAGADILKVEGPCYDIVKALRDKDFRVCGHIGLTPQTIQNYKVQGKTTEDAERLYQEALGLEGAGCELLVMEMLPAVLARKITDQLKIPSIGIGAGPYCDGQVLVLYDLLGLDPDFSPRFLKKFFAGHEKLGAAISDYACEVAEQRFPSSENSF